MVRMASTGGSRHNGVSLSSSLSIYRGRYSKAVERDSTYDMERHQIAMRASKKRKPKLNLKLKQEKP